MSGGLGEQVRTKVRALVAEHKLLGIGALIAAVVIGIAALFGGLESRADGKPVAAVGDVVDAGPWEITLQRSVAIVDLDGLFHDHEGDRWIAVTTMMTNTSDRTMPALRASLAEAVTVRPFAGMRDTAVRVLLTSDGSLAELQPGLTVQVAFIWEQDGTVPVPARVEVALTGWTDRRDSLTGERAWWDPATVATATLDVVDRTEGAG